MRSFSASYSSPGRIGSTTCSPEVLGNLCFDALGVLRRDQQLFDLDRLTVGVAHADLRLAVGAQIAERAVLADRRQALGEAVRERDRQRHQRLGLVRRVAEHHSLVAGAGDVQLIVVARVVARLVCLVDALCDVRRLLVDRVEHRAGVGREAEIGVGVADRPNRLARDLLDVDVGLGRDLSRDHDQAGVDERLAGDASVRFVAEHRIEHSVGDLIGDLVRMSLGDGLGREQEFVVGRLVHGSGGWLLVRWGRTTRKAARAATV